MPNFYTRFKLCSSILDLYIEMVHTRIQALANSVVVKLRERNSLAASLQLTSSRSAATSHVNHVTTLEAWAGAISPKGFAISPKDTSSSKPHCSLAVSPLIS
jgi:hypothetical protein